VNDSTKLDLAGEDLRIVAQILLARVPDRPAYVFGSRATGHARRRSDLDLAIGGTAPLTLRQRALLTDDFDESDLPIKVDVVDLNAISPEFRQRIERDFILIRDAAPVREQVLA
jgi:predicted nucleotidyltransferase